MKRGESKGSAVDTVSDKDLDGSESSSEESNASLLDVAIFGEVDMWSVMGMG